MKKPIYQIIIETIILISAGIVFLGSFLDAISNSISLINFSNAFWWTIVLSGLYILLLFLVKFKKIIWVSKAGDKLRVTKISKRVTFSFTGILLLLWTGALVDFQNNITLPKSPKVHPVFSLRDNRFKVLILPFDQECDYENKKYDVGKVIQKRLENINGKDSVNLNIHYLTDSIELTNFTARKAQLLMNFHHADMILYGSYSYKQCEGGTSDKICYNYLTDYRKWNLQELHSHKEYKMLDFTGLDDVRKGTGQEGIDYIIYCIAGMSAISKKNFAGAIQKFKKIKAYSANERILFQMGYCYYFMHEYTNARLCLKKLLQINPNNREATIHVGSTLIKENKIAEAKAYFKKMLLNDSTNISILYNLASLYNLSKDTVTAERYFEKLIKLIPDSSFNLELLGRVNEGMGKLSKAKEYYQKYLMMHANHEHNAAKWIELARLYHKIGDTAGSAACLWKAVNMDSTFAEAWYRLGIYYGYIRKDYSESMKYLKKASELLPDNIDIIYTQAKVAAYMHHKANTLSYLSQVFTLSPSVKKLASTEKAFDWLKDTNEFLSILQNH